MLSTSVIKNVADAGHYYSAVDNYYTKEEGIEQSEWYGKGAVRLNLIGEVDATQFTNLLKGQLPNGEQLGKVVDGLIKHRAGWDLTLSAPKSVSVMALVGGDIRLIEAHRLAVKMALSQIERGASEARIKINGDISYQNTKNLIAALYHHDLSREQDPQLHTHSVVMNMTERSDGKWRSQASKMGRYDKETASEVHGFIERVRHNKRYFGKLYEAELCYQVNQLGYKTAVNPKTGVFEIVDVPKEVIEHFSKRRFQIEKSLAENGLTGGKAADVATIKTRENKKIVDREELKETWKKEALALGLNGEAIIQKTHAPLTIRTELDDKLPNHVIDAIKVAAKELSQFKSTFLLEEVITLAADFAIRENINVDTLIKAANHVVDTGELITLENESGKTVLMNKDTINDENQIKKYLTESSGFHQNIKPSVLQQFLDQHHEIQLDEKKALQEIFSDQRTILVEGEMARESLVKPIVQMAKAGNATVAIVSPNQIISQRMAALAETEPQTVWEHIKLWFFDASIKHYSTMQFLNNLHSKSPDILLVDKSNLLSTYELKNLMEWSNDQNKQIIFFANKEILLSQKQGVGMNLFIQNGVKTISLAEKTDSIRHDIAQQDMQKVIHKISNHIIEINNPDDRLQAMAKQFSRIQNRDHVFLIANNKQSVERLNQLAHEELKKTGVLGNQVSVKILLPQYISENKRRLESSYQKGHWVRFNEVVKTLDIKRGDYLQVVANNKTKNEITLINGGGKLLVWNPDKSYKTEYFKAQEREFSVGERIQFHRALWKEKIIKGEQFTIKNIFNTKLKLVNENNKTVLLDVNKLHHSHIDYGYAATPHNIVHENPSHIIAELPANSFHTDKRRFFQLVSQPKDISIYTDNVTSLITTLERKTGDRLSAQDILKQSENLKINLHSFYDVLEKAISLQEKGTTEKILLSKKAIDAVNYAIHHLSEREAGFTHKELMKAAMQHAIGKISPNEFSSVIVAMEKANILLRGNRSDGTLWTTLDSVNTERQIATLCFKDKGKFEPIATTDVIQNHSDIKHLHSEQIDAIKKITQSCDRILVIQGRAGTGKTTLMTTLSDVLAAKDIFHSQGYELHGLAPTHPAVKELTARGIPAQTLDSFLIEIQNGQIKRDFSRSIFVLDEASMVSNHKMLQILKIAHDANMRQLIPVGDIRQLASIEAGKPHELIQKSVDPIKLENIRRQENSILKKAVKETYDYEFAKAFQTLKESIIEIGNPQTHPEHKNKAKWDSIAATGRMERIQALVADYISYPIDQRPHVQVITPGHADRIFTNTLIREHLKQEGILSGQEQSFTILSSKNMTRTECSEIQNYQTGNVLRFNQAEGNIKAREYLTIMDIKLDSRILVLENKEGNEVLWQVPQSKGRGTMEVFTKEERSLQVGDIIRWSRSDSKNGLLSSQPVKVTGIQKGNITIEYPDGKQQLCDTKNPQFQHWDHNYALTVYAAQGGTKKIVLALLESYRENLIHQPAFLVALTRAVDTFRIYTDNIPALLDRIIQNTGTKISSLEVIGESKALDQKSPKNITLKSANLRGFDKHTVERIIENLNQDAEKIATEFLGKPISRHANYLQFGSKQGSLRVTTQGSKQGLWNDFSGDFSEAGKTGGNMFQFLQVFGGMSKKEALQYGARRFGLDTNKSQSSREISSQWKKEADRHRKERQKIEGQQQKDKANFAKKLAAQSQPIQGTLAEKYLKEYRGVTLENYSDDLRYHSGIYSKLNEKTYPAMLVIARDGKGEITAVQATYLNPKTANKIDKSEVKIQRQTFGFLSGSAVTLKGKTSDKTFIAEGTETGLSLAKSFPEAEVKIILGKSNFLHISPHASSKNMIFCLDNDGKNIRDDKIIYEAAKRLINAGKNVHLIMPTALGNQKQDYNDLIKKGGIEAVRHDVNKALPYHVFYGEKTKLDYALPLNISTENIKGVHQQSVSLPISNETIQKFANELNKNTVQKEKAIVASYRAISHDSTQKEVSRSIPKSIQPEREI
jgi:conjugative transfer relaxase protein TraI